MWVWVKIKPPGDRRFWSMFPLTRVPLWFLIFEPHPCVSCCQPARQVYRVLDANRDGAISQDEVSSYDAGNGFQA